jgi:cell division transport system permease protein
MSEIQQKKKPRKAKPNYLYAIISMALVLFFLGITLAFILEARGQMRSMKESIMLMVELDDKANEVDQLQLETRMQNERFVGDNIELVSKDEAARRYEEELGRNFTQTLGFNPLFASINFNVKAEYANVDSIAMVKQELIGHPIVKDVHYNQLLLDAVDQNSGRLLIMLLVIGGLLIVISVTLIDSTIRLAMFSNRFLIRSMQLVGATRWFIIRPFVSKAFFNGFLAVIIAGLAIVGFAWVLSERIAGVRLLSDLVNFAAVLGIVLIVGLAISLLSTYLAVSKYLRMKLDDLY